MLHSPDTPHRHIRLFHLIYLARLLLAVHEVAQLALGSLHHQFEVVLLLNGERQSRQRDKGIARATLEPRITCQQVAVVILRAEVELMGGIDQTVEEVVTRRTQRYLFLEKFLQLARLNLRGRCGKDNALAFLDAHLEIARHVQILIGGISTLLLLRIFHATIPVGMEDELILF